MLLGSTLHHAFIKPRIMFLTNTPNSFVWFPLVRPSSEFAGEIDTGGGVTAFIGATIFVLGSYLLLLEAFNENRSGCFGWAVHELVDDSEEMLSFKYVASESECEHHHPNNPFTARSANSSVKDTGSPEMAPNTKPRSPDRGWVWFPPWSDLRDRYLHELGFLASAVQMVAATVFWISGFTALPGIFNHLSPGLLDGIYWTPQIIGGSGFILSGVMFMLETQEKWYKPALNVLGWHIGLWNMIGGLGFALCPAFGYDTSTWAQYQASLSTFWGSWAFLIGSLIQLYESLQKYPVDIKRV
jgi:hypothetical protein